MTRDAIFDSIDGAPPVCTGRNLTCTCSLCRPNAPDAPDTIPAPPPSVDPHTHYGEPPPPPAAPSVTHRRSFGLDTDYDFNGFADADD